MQQTAGLHTRLRCDLGADGERLSAALEDGAYRIVQEALTNVVKHAQASRVDVSLQLADGALEIEVSDNGRGIEAADNGSGFGLIGMRERVDLLDGELSMRRGEPSGTVIRARLPLSGTAALQATA